MIKNELYSGSLKIWWNDVFYIMFYLNVIKATTTKQTQNLLSKLHKGMKIRIDEQIHKIDLSKSY